MARYSGMKRRRRGILLSKKISEAGVYFAMSPLKPSLAILSGGTPGNPACDTEAAQSAGIQRIHCAEVWGGTAARVAEVRTPGIAAALHSSAAGLEHGGDMYYFSVCKYESLTRIAIADVRGHGVEAARVSEWMYRALESRMNDDDGARVLADLNAVAHKAGLQAMTTAAVATLHRERRRLSYCYAGHPPMLLGQPGNFRPLTVGDRPLANLPLGVLPNTTFTTGTARISPGDRLVLYTDGVTECPDSAERFYGMENLIHQLNDTALAAPSAARHSLVAALVQHAGGALTHDDCTFLMAEVLEPPASWWGTLGGRLFG